MREDVKGSNIYASDIKAAQATTKKTQKKHRMITKTQFVKWETPGSENTVRGKHAQPFLTPSLQLATHKLLLDGEQRTQNRQCSIGWRTLIAKCKKLKCKI